MNNKIQIAQGRLMLTHPWFASLLLSVPKIEKNSITTIATDGKNIYYNNNFIESISIKEIIGSLVHELCHCFLLHCIRIGSRNKAVWNIAADAAVNNIVLKAGFKLPDGYIPPDKNNLTVEELYEKYKNEKIDPKLLDLLESKISYENKSEEIERHWRRKMAECRGFQPNFLNRQIEETYKVKIDWRQIVSNFISSTIRSDEHSWSKYSRRCPLLAGRKRDPSIKICLCIDTSGSIDDKILSIFVSEVLSILSINGIDAMVISADAEVHDIIEPGDKIPPRFMGGGGTDFRPAIKLAEKRGVENVIYFTDGDGTFPETSTCNILWCFKGAIKEPPVGKSIVID